MRKYYGVRQKNTGFIFNGHIPCLQNRRAMLIKNNENMNINKTLFSFYHFLVLLIVAIIK